MTITESLLHELDLDAVLDTVEGKSISVVGNSLHLLDEGLGEEIDRQDLVLRMNFGVPGFLRGGTPEAIGSRLDLLAAARVDPVEQVLARTAPAQLWWMKRTAVGRSHLAELRRSRFLQEREVALWVWPEELEDEVRDFVGAPPSTGIRMLYFLSRIAEPSELRVFGVSWWGQSGGSERNSWRPSRVGPDPAHQPGREHTAFLSLGFLPCADGGYEL